MTTATDLCGRGFLPRELPPPFTSSSFGVLVQTGWTPSHQKTTPSTHDLFRWGALRRRLAIPNPLAFVHLAREVEAQWTNLAPLLALSKFSLSAPTATASRALEPAKQHRVIPIAQAANRAGARYVVRTDISQFYQSIYTHTLEWAAHSKQVVKANRALPRKKQQALWGRGLDDRHRDLQDHQSVGIPIGPDTSLVAAELLLARVDDVFYTRVPSRGLRYVDDYELCFKTLSDAENGLAELQQALSEYQLYLNPHKTKIIQLPDPLEPGWVRALRRVRVRGQGGGQRSDIIDLLDSAFELSRSAPDEHVLKYAMGVLKNRTCIPSNWAILQALMLQVVVAEPGVIREVLVELVKYESLGYTLDKGRIAEALALVIERHAPLGHGSEVAWAVWAHIQLSLSLDVNALSAIERMEDSVVALVTLDAESRGLCPRQVQSATWTAMTGQGSLFNASWLLAYEAGIKGWLANPHLSKIPDFVSMKSAGVSFYTIIPAPSAAPINLQGPGAGPGVTGGGGGGGGWSP